MAELNASAWLAAQQESRASDRDSREKENERKSFERSKEKQQKILYNLTDTHLALIA